MKQAHRQLNNLAWIISIMLDGYVIVSYGEASSASPTGKLTTTDTAKAASNLPARSESGIAGVWQGSTLADCGVNLSFSSRCNAEQEVTIR